jgi:hypothetical protein
VTLVPIQEATPDAERLLQIFGEIGATEIQRGEFSAFSGRAIKDCSAKKFPEALFERFSGTQTTFHSNSLFHSCIRYRRPRKFGQSLDLTTAQKTWPGAKGLAKRLSCSLKSDGSSNANRVGDTRARGPSVLIQELRVCIHRGLLTLRSYCFRGATSQHSPEWIPISVAEWMAASSL